MDGWIGWRPPSPKERTDKHAKYTDDKTGEGKLGKQPTTSFEKKTRSGTLVLQYTNSTDCVSSADGVWSRNQQSRDSSPEFVHRETKEDGQQSCTGTGKGWSGQERNK